MLRNRSVFFLSLSILFALGCAILNSNTDTSDDQINSIERNLNSKAQEVNREAEIILSDHGAVAWASLHNSFFLMDSTGVLAWSKSQFFPEARSADSLLGFQLLQNNSGDFLLK